jgi:hypothetical protein
MLVWLRQTGALPAFLDSYLGQNFDRVAESWLLGLQKAWRAEELFLLALTTGVLYALSHRRKTALPEGVVALTAVSGTLLLLFLRLPTHYEQSLLPILPAAAVVIAWTIGQWLQLTWKTRWQRPLQLVLLLLTAASSFDHAWFRNDSDTDMHAVQARLALLPEDAMLFEGVGMPLFQPRPFIYKAFVNTLCERMRKGQLGIDVVTTLDLNNVAYAAWDKRIAKMGDQIGGFLRNNFLPLHDGGLLAAGTMLPATDGGEVLWNIRIAGRYFRNAEAKQNIFVDGLPMGSFVDLTDGPHSFSWTGSNALILSIAPPEQWAPLDAIAAWKNKAFTPIPN